MQNVPLGRVHSGKGSSPPPRKLSIGTVKERLQVDKSIPTGLAVSIVPSVIVCLSYGEVIAILIVGKLYSIIG